MYEMLTGSRAFPEQNLAKLVTGQIEQQLRAARQFFPENPPPCATLCTNVCGMKKKEDAERPRVPPRPRTRS